MKFSILQLLVNKKRRRNLQMNKIFDKKYFVILMVLILSINVVYAEKDILKNLGVLKNKPVLFPLKTANPEDTKHSPLEFSPDGKEIYYSVHVKETKLQKIFFIKFEDGKWSSPKVVNFSGKHEDGHPVFSKDGTRIYFYSKRPITKKDSINPNYDIWYSEKNGQLWSDPIWAGKNINSEENESVIKIDEKNTMYIHTYKEKIWKLYKAEFVNGEYQKRKLIKVLSDPEEFKKPYEFKNKDYFIIGDNIKKGKYYYSYLKISVKKDNGKWTEFTDMGELINEGEGGSVNLFV